MDHGDETGHHLSALTRDQFTKTRYIATASGGDSRVIAWDKKDLHMAQEHAPRSRGRQRSNLGVTSLCCVDRDNYLLAIGYRDKKSEYPHQFPFRESADTTTYEVRVWNVEHGYTDTMDGSHDNAVTALFTFHCSGSQKTLVSGSDDSTLRIWSVDTDWTPLQQGPIGTCNSVLSGGHTHGVMCLASNNNHVFSGGYDAGIAVWDVNRPDNKCLLRLQGHADWIRCLVWHKFCNQLISASDDGTIRIWDTRTGKEEQRMTGHSSFIYGMIIHSDGLLYTSSEDRSIKKWDIRALLSDVDTIRIHESEIYNLCSVSDQYICAHSECTTKGTTEIKLLDVRVSPASLSVQNLNDSSESALGFMSSRTTSTDGIMQIEVASAITGLQTSSDRWSRSLVLV